MNKIWLIIKREYWTRVRRKSFILSTLLAPLGILAVMAFQVIILTKTMDKKTILVKDDSGYFANDRGQVKFPDANNVFYKGSTEPLEELKLSYVDQNYDGVLYIPKLNLQNPSGIQYFSDRPLGMATRTIVEGKMSRILRNEKVKLEGLEPSFLDKIKTNVSISEQKLGKEGEAAEETSSIVASAAGGLMGFLMYLTIIVYGTMVMKGIAEEKTNRIVEVMLSSVKPFNLMLGKIVGIGAVGLTQFFIWILSAGLLFFAMGLVMNAMMDAETLQQMSNAQASSAAMDQEDIQMEITKALESVKTLPLGWMIFSFVFFFFGGYLLYASLFAAVGSAVGEDASESQALVMPITVPIILSFIILTTIIENPNGPLAFWSSIIPLSSPIIMPARIAYGLSPFSLDFILSIILMIAGFLFTTWLAAKIYRTAILMTGKKITAKEMWRWVRMN